MAIPQSCCQSYGQLPSNRAWPLDWYSFLFPLRVGGWPSHWVCKPAYLVPVSSQDKLGGLCEEGHSCIKWWGWQRWGTNYSGWSGSPSRLLVHLPVLSSFCSRKSRRWRNVPSGTGSPGCPGQSPQSRKMVVCVLCKDRRLSFPEWWYSHKWLSNFIDLISDNHITTRLPPKFSSSIFTEPVHPLRIVQHFSRFLYHLPVVTPLDIPSLLFLLPALPVVAEAWVR